MDRLQTFVAAVVGVILGSLTPTNLAFADTDAYKQLSAEWWQWVLSVPASVNPLTDATGEDCMIGQRGTNWFLAGTFFGGSVTRACDIPQGATLFFPVINSVGIDTPGQCGQGEDPIPSSVYREGAAAFIDGATNLSVTLDGQAAGPMHRTVSQVFEVALPADNLFAGPCGGLAAGIYSPAIDDGYYVRLNPLAVGPHTVQIHAENPDASFVLDVTYNLNVVPLVTK